MDLIKHENLVVVDGLKKMKEKVLSLKARVYHQEL